MNGKLKLLAWSDSVLAATGFGTVSRHVLAELHKTGRYQIDQLAINYRGESFDANRFPYQLMPAHLLDPSDPYGRTQIVQSLQQTDYDILWILNNTEIVEPIIGELEKLQAARMARDQAAENHFLLSGGQHDQSAHEQDHRASRCARCIHRIWPPRNIKAHAAGRG